MARMMGLLLAAASVALWTGCGGGGSGSGGPAPVAIDADPNASPAVDSGYFEIPSTALGALVNGANVTFNYWNPSATAVEVDFYANWNDALTAPVAASTVKLTRGTGGVWTSGSIPLPAQNFYVYNVGGTYVLDPYARSMAQWQHAGAGIIQGDSIGKGAILDWAAIQPDTPWTAATYFDGSAMLGPDGKAAPYAYRSNRDAIIYEAGIRDLTVDPALDFSATGHQWGTFKALVDLLPHIQKLGVTHVQLLCPLENYYYDQTLIGHREIGAVPGSGGADYSAMTKGANYNWGYDPQNYFTPSGMYSSSPGDPAARVNELKTLINEIHRQGMGVILDVVYNHTANAAVLGDAVNAGYWYRASNRNGAGSNDVETEHKMVRKLIVDSISQWVDGYHVDGFRFDLMGVIDTQTIKDAYAAAQAANPKALLLGEGWNSYYTGAAVDYNGVAVTGSDQQDATAFAGMNVGMFSDSYRNLFKNGYPSDGGPAFLTGKAQAFGDLFKNVSGQPTNTNPAFPAPGPDNVVNYLTCHDNLCYYDCLSAATASTKAGDAVILQRAKVGYAVLLTSQGTAFLHAGDEMFRTKETTAGSSAANTKTGSGTRVFVDNSYNASDAINKVDWSKVYTFGNPLGGAFANYDTTQNGYQLYAYTQGLIALRKSTTAFRLSDAALAAPGTLTAIASDSGTGSVLAFGYKIVTTDVPPATYYVLHNADTATHTFVVDASLASAQLLVDGVKAGLAAIPSSTTATVQGTDGRTVQLTGLSSAVFKF